MEFVLINDYQIILGNPNLEAEKTVNYEFGYWEEINNYMNSSEEKRLSALPKLIDKIRNSGGIEYSEKKSKDLLDSGKKILNNLPNSTYKNSLEIIVEYLGSRKK